MFTIVEKLGGAEAVIPHLNISPRGWRKSRERGALSARSMLILMRLADEQNIAYDASDFAPHPLQNGEELSHE